MTTSARANTALATVSSVQLVHTMPLNNVGEAEKLFELS